MLYIFVEGYFDENFFSKVFFTKSDEDKFIQYSSLKAEKVNSFVSSIKSMPNCDYLFFADCDECTISDKRADMLTKYNQVEAQKLFIVQYEIESWYYAGVCEHDCQNLKLKHFEFCTDTVTKEVLIAKMKKPNEKQYVLAKMLQCYSVHEAMSRNTSLRFFVHNYTNEPIAAV